MVGAMPDTKYFAIDLAPPPPGWRDGPACGWMRCDWREALARCAPTVVVANLFLHHFDDGELRSAATGFRDAARVMIFREPARRRAWMRHFLRPLGLHAITRHDMAVSIRAGFLADELPRALGLDAGWHVRVRHTLFGACEMCAVRRPDAAR
jgi:hypothetical protein